MVVFRSIPNEEKAELGWYNCKKNPKNFWSTWIYMLLKVAATMKGWGVTELFILLSSPFFPQKEKLWYSLHMLIQQSLFCSKVISCKISSPASLAFLCK